MESELCQLHFTWKKWAYNLYEETDARGMKNEVSSTVKMQVEREKKYSVLWL